MKNVLFATTALVAVSVAGTSYADSHTGFTWSAETTAGYNDDVEGGGFIDASFDVKATLTTDQGITFGLGWGFEYDSGAGDVAFDSFPTLSAESAAGKLVVGDVDDFAAEQAINTINIVDFFDGLEDDFTDEDGEFALDFEGTLNGFSYGFSSIIGDGTGANGGLGDLSFGASGEFGSFKFGIGYEQAGFDDFAEGGDVHDSDVLGVGLQTTFSGATFGLAYIDSGDVATTAIGVAYDLGNGIYLGAFYGFGETDDVYGISAAYDMDPLAVKLAWRTGDFDGDSDRTRLSAEYTIDVVTLFAGYSTNEISDGNYIGADIDLGSGATFTISYAEQDEAWGREFKGGTSAYVNVAF
jgi:outer membrane protein OmpU